MTSQTVYIDDAELRRKLYALGGPALRRVGKRVTSSAMKPVLEDARARTPVGPTGRLRASLGKQQTQSFRGGLFGSRVGMRRDFVYKNTSGDRVVTGRGKVRDRAIKKGHKQDDGSANWYGRIIEVGHDKQGRMRRKAGGAHFLDDSITSKQTIIIGTVTADLRRFVQSI